ncbi:MAG TPA: hypothetical protein VJ863_01905 [Sphaerochaeta sp.]|nr:hypothetical protein [Sphaerochaeta sp.]
MIDYTDDKRLFVDEEPLVICTPRELLFIAIAVCTSLENTMGAVLSLHSKGRHQASFAVIHHIRDT